MLHTEADVIDTLAGGSVTLDELYTACEASGVIDRAAGKDVIWGKTDTRWKRRVRNRLQALKRAGRARHQGDGVWVIDGSRTAPRRLTLFVSSSELTSIELALADAGDILAELAAAGVEVDLVVADPPWALRRQELNDPTRDRGERTYARDANQVVGGYVEVDPDRYTMFTHRWVDAAASLLLPRPGSYLAAITGPQQAARVQVAAEDAGLTYVNAVVTRRVFPLRTTRRFSHAHNVVTILTAGNLDSKKRFFHTPAALPKARSGVDYPLDWWSDLPRPDRRGLLRYDNALPVALVERLLEALTRGPDNGFAAGDSLVVDPFCGSGTTPVACWNKARRCIAADLNPQSLRFTAARLLDEHVNANAQLHLLTP